MAEFRDKPYSQGYGFGHGRQPSDQIPRSHKVVKAATAATAGGSLLFLSGLTMAGTVIGLTIATPLFVIFSPVLVPAVITVSLLAMGLWASGGFGVAAITVLLWIFRYVTAKRPPGAGQVGQARYRLGGKAREMEDGGASEGADHAVDIWY